MAQYLLSIYQPDGPRPPPEALAAIMGDVEAVNREARAAGAWVLAAGLHPPGAATVLRFKDGQLLTTDGPFVEGKEHIGGFTVIEAPDLDAAMAWAAKYARAIPLPIEVRPIQPGHAAGGNG